MESAFRDTRPDDLKVIETFRSDPAEGFVRWDCGHRQRLIATCKRLGIAVPCDHALSEALATVPKDVPRRVRLTVDLAGQLDIQCPPAGKTASQWRIALSEIRFQSDDPWLGVKTTNRAQYDSARSALPDGIDEMVFCNQRGDLTEGTITNLFVQTSQGLATPPLTAGVLPGVLRGTLIDSGQAFEKNMRPEDLFGARIWMGNSLRGMIPATLV